MIMNKVREIENFLYKMLQLAKSGVDVDYHLVYSNLVNINVSTADRRRYINNNFDYWINSFKKAKNTKVFVDQGWNYFCQFINRKENSKLDFQKIKVYVPIDSEHICDSAIKIFDFLDKNNISHTSKIGSKIRNDNIVIRTDDLFLVEKIVNFIESDKNISDGLMPMNPFSFNYHGIALAWDGCLSYNNVVSKVIASYINDIKDSDRNISYSDFCGYVFKLYNDTFVSGLNVEEFMSKMNLEGNDDSVYSELANYAGVLKMFAVALEPEASLNHFYDTYREVSGDSYHESISNKFSNLTVYERCSMIWDDIYLNLVDIYGVEQVSEIVNCFIDTGNYNYFTRKNNIRQKMIDNGITPVILKNIIMEKKSIALEEASVKTYFKYGDVQLYDALEKLRQGDYKYFTNDDGVRNNLKRYAFLPEELDEIINYSISMYRDDLVGIENINDKYISYIGNKYLQKRHR